MNCGKSIRFCRSFSIDLLRGWDFLVEKRGVCFRGEPTAFRRFTPATRRCLYAILQGYSGAYADFRAIATWSLLLFSLATSVDHEATCPRC